jgi:hypothetical protein
LQPRVGLRVSSDIVGQLARFDVGRPNAFGMMAGAAVVQEQDQRVKRARRIHGPWKTLQPLPFGESKKSRAAGGRYKEVERQCRREGSHLFPAANRFHLLPFAFSPSPTSRRPDSKPPDARATGA